MIHRTPEGWKASDYFPRWVDDLVSNTRARIADAERYKDYPVLAGRKPSLERELGLYLRLRQVVYGELPEPANPADAVEPRLIKRLQDDVNDWATRVREEGPDLPISDEEKSELNQTLVTAELISKYLPTYPITEGRRTGLPSQY